MGRPDGGALAGWRTRALVLPMVITVVGVLASYVLADLITPSCGSSEVCAYIVMAYLGQFLLILAAGLVVVGLVVGFANGGGKPPIRGMVAGVGLVALPGAVMLAFGSGYAESFMEGASHLPVSVLAMAVLAIVALLPLGLGYALARAIKRLRPVD